MTLSIVFHALWLTMMVSIGVALLGVHDLLQNLRRNHPVAWHKLGEPSLIFNNSLQNNFLVLKFLFRREYLQLKDNVIDGKARRVELAYLVALALFVLTLVSLPLTV